LIYILQVMFCVGGFGSLISCIVRLSEFLPLTFRKQCEFSSYSVNKPCKCKPRSLNWITLFAIVVSLTLVIVWYIFRRHSWAWILQDLIGASLCIMVLSIYRLGNMKVITIILCLFFVYDVFFVFITPYIPLFNRTNSKSSSSNTSTPGGTSINNGTYATVTIRKTTSNRNPSVMEQVALGFGSDDEVVPLLFSLPSLVKELNPCLKFRNSMLGFGDIILPGILLTFCKIFDIASNHRRHIYYIQSLIGYFIGFTCTNIALIVMESPQPALLYLVPCTLLTTIITGLVRHELKELYTGKRIKQLLETKSSSLLHQRQSNDSIDTNGIVSTTSGGEIK